MPKNNNQVPAASTKAPKSLKDLASTIQSTSDDIYSKIYYTSKNDQYDLDTLKSNIDKSIDSIMRHNMDTSGKPNISSVYTRLLTKQIQTSVGNSPFGSEFKEVFENQSLMDAAAESYSKNTYIKQFDSEIDLICQYMPKLDEAIEIKKDTVLFADQFNKDFLSVQNDSAINTDSTFNSKIRIIKDKYDLQNIIEDSVVKAWKYGEDFLYIIPYKKAFEKIFERRKKLPYMPGRTGTTAESVALSESFMIKESYSAISESRKSTEEHEFSFSLTLNYDNAITESIVNMYNASKQYEAVMEAALVRDTPMASLEEAEKAGLTHSVSSEKFSKSQSIPDDTVPTGDDGAYNALKKSTSAEGLINPNASNTKDDNVEITKIPGCIVKRLERHRVIPIYIEDLCMGYYYVKIKSDPIENKNKYTTYMDMGQRFGQRLANMSSQSNDPIKNDSMLRKISAEIAAKIDAKFINTNQDIAKELYMILKYDEEFNQNTSNIDITFIPPSDLEHIYFKMNSETHRGISLLEKSLIPAKIYISLYMTYAVGMMTRGQDKRVYYVKQQVETNISKTLLSAINQIKKGNFGVRNLENLMNVLNITGQYNDYFIPKSASGEAPIDFEVLQGQQFDPKMEFLQQFEDYAIGCTGVPIELISSRQSVDYALQLTMTNSKHIRIVYKDQANVQRIAGKIVTRIYNAEYDENVSLTVKLPPPLYIAMSNTSQLLTNTTDYMEKILVPDMQAKGASENAINAAKMVYMRKTLGTYMNFDDIEEAERQGMQQTASVSPDEGE